MGLLRKKVSKFSLKAAKEDTNRPPTPPPQLPPLPGHILRQEQQQQQQAKDVAAGPSQQHQHHQHQHQQRRRSRSLWSGSDEARLAAGSRLGRRGSLSATPEPGGAQPWRSREAWLALHQSPVGAAAAVPTLPVPFGPGGDMPGWRSRGATGGGFFGTAAELDNTIVRNSENSNSDGRRTPVPGTPSRRLRSSPSVPSLAPSPSKLGRLEFAAPPMPSTPSPARSSPFTPRAMRRRSRSVDSMAAFASPAFEFSTPTEGPSANSSMLVTPPSAGPTPSLVHSAAERLSPPVHASPLIDDHAGSVLERVDSTSSSSDDSEEVIRQAPSTPSRPSRAPARALPAVPVHALSEDGHVQQHVPPPAFAPRTTSLPSRGRASSVSSSVPTVVPVPVVQQAVVAQVEGESETDAEEVDADGDVIDFSRPAPPPAAHATRPRYSGPSSSSHGHGYPTSSHGHGYPTSSHGHGSLPPSAMPANMVPTPQHAQMYPTAIPIESNPRPPTRTGSSSSYRSHRTGGGPPSRSASSAGHSDRDPHANAVPHTPQAIAHAVNVWRQKSKGKEGREEAEKAMSAARPPSTDGASRHTRRVPSFGSIRPRASRADRIEAAMRKQAPGGAEHWAADDKVEPHVAADPFAHAGAWEAPNTYSVYGGINEFEPPAPIQTEPLFKPPTRLPQLGARPTTPQMGARPTTPQMHHQQLRPTTPQMHHPRSMTPQMHHRPTTPQMHHPPTTPHMQRPSALPYLPQQGHYIPSQGQGHYIPAHRAQRMQQQQPVGGQGGWI